MNKYGKQPEHQAQLKADSVDATMPTPMNVLIIPWEDEGFKLPWRNFHKQPECTEGLTTSLPHSSALGSYAFVQMPHSEEENPMFIPISLECTQMLTFT